MFLGVIKLFVWSFENNSRWKVEIKDYNARIDEQNVFDQSVKNDLKANDSVPNITGDQGDDYTTGCLVDYPFF